MAGTVRSGHGAHLSVEQALTLFGDSRIMPVVLGKTHQITEYGSTHRIFTQGQRPETGGERGKADETRAGNRHAARSVSPRALDQRVRPACGSHNVHGMKPSWVACSNGIASASWPLMIAQLPRW